MSYERRSTKPLSTWQLPKEHVGAVLKDPWYRCVSSTTSAMIRSTFEYFLGLGYQPVLAPVTTGAISSPMGLGSDSLPVSTQILGEETYLADSMQFQLEALLRLHDRGVFYIMPTFRGEEHDQRHLNQFFHAEAELRGCLADVQAIVSGYVMALTRALLNDELRPLIMEAAGSVDHLDSLLAVEEIPVISYAEARRMLPTSRSWNPLPQGYSLTDAGEKELVEAFGQAVWVERPPVATVPFYQRSDDGETALAADLLFARTGEVAGCGERWVDADQVRTALRAHAVSEEAYWWYLTMKSLTPLGTCGFGLGFERFMQWALKCPDIRDLQLFPRLKGQPTGI